MTGYASLTRNHDVASIGVTVRAVNHRYLDVQVRLPGGIAGLEPRVRALVQRRLSRGRVEIAVSLHMHRPTEVTVELNEPLLEALTAAIDKVRERGLVVGDLQAADLLRLPQALAIREHPIEEDASAAAALADAVSEAVDAALVELDEMRAREGGHLGADLDGRRDTLDALIGRIDAAADQARGDLHARLTERVSELTRELAHDATAVAQEIVRAAARMDISEELVRFRAHLAHWTQLAGGPEACGRKLDFLLQEMNREINTIGSKSESAAVAELIVTAKAELEKMREQAQNVE